MTVSLTIAGGERITDLWRRSLKTKNVLTNEMDSCQFELRGTRPAEGSEVIITDSVHGDMFKGIVDKVSTKRRMPERVWAVKGVDYTYSLDQLRVVESYEGWTAGDIVLDILLKYCTGFTGVHVQAGSPTVELISFNYKRPSECFKELAKYIGWSWFVDPDKDVWFFSARDLGMPAPESITSTSFVRDFQVDFNRLGLANLVYVIGGVMLSDFQTVEWKADGVSRAWALPWKPAECYLEVGAVAVDPSGAVGIENVDDDSGFDYMVSLKEVYLRASSGTATIPAGTTITLRAKQEIPVITVVEDTDSQDAIKAVEGGAGIYEEVIADDSLVTVAAAEAAGLAYLADHANPEVSGSFTTLTPGWHPGQLVTITLPDDGLNNVYVIESVETHLVDGQWEWKVDFGGRLKGIPDILQALVSAQQQKQKQETALLAKFIYDPVAISIVDEDAILSARTLPFIFGDPDAIAGLTEASSGADIYALGSSDSIIIGVTDMATMTTEGIITVPGTEPIMVRITESASVEKDPSGVVGAGDDLLVRLTDTAELMRDGLNVERKAGTGEWVVIAIVDDLPYQDNGPDGGYVSGVTYYYRVRTITDGVPGDYSNEASVLWSGDSTLAAADTLTVTMGEEAQVDTGEVLNYLFIGPYQIVEDI